MQPTFSSLREYAQFAFAKDFRHGGENRVFRYQKNVIEKVGQFLVTPITSPLDLTLRNIQRLLVINSLALAAMSLVTIAFYPEHFIHVIERFAPFLLFKVSTLKLISYIASQSIILGFGVRTFGRLCNNELMTAWNQRIITSVPLGTELIHLLKQNP